MPLRKGSSQGVISRNIEEMLHSYHRTGKIGDTSPRNEKHARRIASAAAHQKARGSQKTRRKRR